MRLGNPELAEASGSREPHEHIPRYRRGEVTTLECRRQTCPGHGVPEGSGERTSDRCRGVEREAVGRSSDDQCSGQLHRGAVVQAVATEGFFDVVELRVKVRVVGFRAHPAGTDDVGDKRLVLGSVTDVAGHREERLTRPVEVTEHAAGARQVSGPEVIEHPRVERPVTRMDGQHVDARRQARQDPVGTHRPEAEVILASDRRKGSRSPHGAGFIPAPLRVLRVANRHPQPCHSRRFSVDQALQPQPLEAERNPRPTYPAWRLDTSHAGQCRPFVALNRRTWPPRQRRRSSVRNRISASRLTYGSKSVEPSPLPTTLR